jgi:hypothetical protein
MIRTAITPAAYAAIAATLALGTVAVEPERAQDGSVHIWLDPAVMDGDGIKAQTRALSSERGWKRYCLGLKSERNPPMKSSTGTKVFLTKPKSLFLLSSLMASSILDTL